jgi:hypothetical protein
MRKSTYSALLFAPGAGVSASSSSVLARAYADRSPIYGVAVSPGYGQWQLVAASHEEGLNVRGILGNSLAIKAYRDRKVPFPNVTVLTIVARKRVAVPNPPFAGAYVIGAARAVQIMVKDSTRMPPPEAGDMAGLTEVTPSTRRNTGHSLGAMRRARPCTSEFCTIRPLKQRTPAHSL